MKIGARLALSVAAIIASMIGAASASAQTQPDSGDDAGSGPSTTLSCSSGTAVADAANNASLVADCRILMGAKDALRGTGALNWSYGLAITSWDGVTVAGTPKRVTKIVLTWRSLTGTLPSSLGSLSRLTHLTLHDNELTGGIPSTFGSLANLQELNLGDNRLTGPSQPFAE